MTGIETRCPPAIRSCRTPKLQDITGEKSAPSIGVKMLGLGTYNYGHFSRELFHDLSRSSFSGPGPGVQAPDFKAMTLDGETVRLSDYAEKKNVLLIFG